MAFDRSSLFCTSGTSGDAPRVYSYGTTKTAARDVTMELDSYFIVSEV